MKNTVIALLLAVAVDGYASEVGAPNPQLASSATANLAVAIAETGASTSWATQPSKTLATKNQLKEFEMHVEGIDVKLNQELDAAISRKLEVLLEQK